MKEMNLKIKGFCKSLLKKVLAFSLVELMISLIAISVIAAAFTPVISKKLKGGNVTIGGCGVTTGAECHDLDPQCDMCDLCNETCIKCSTTCPSGKTQILKKTETGLGKICECIDCPDGCASCHIELVDEQLKTVCDRCAGCSYLDTTSKKCVACTNSHLSGGTKTCDGVSLQTCSARWKDCETCTCDTCTKCKGNLVWDRASKQCIENTKCGGTNCKVCDSTIEPTPNNCVECNSPSRLDPYTQMCRTASASTVSYKNRNWTNKNAGDAGGPDVPNTAVKVKDVARYGVTILTSLSSPCNAANGACCWQGNTTGNQVSTVGGYSGQSRTVCNWAAADRICSWNAMRLPDTDAINSLGNGTFETNLGTNIANVSMCYLNQGGVDTKTLIGGSAAAQCGGTTNVSGCGGYCSPNSLWGKNGSSSAVSSTLKTVKQSDTKTYNWTTVYTYSNAYTTEKRSNDNGYTYYYDYLYRYESNYEYHSQSGTYNWLIFNNAVNTAASKSQAYSVRCITY